jgi:DNA adenine methylase
VSAPPFTYYGGKQRLADRIVRFLPAHGHYVEPFAGSLAVLLAKPRSRMETVNDRDGDLVAFWRVLRDRPDELALHMALTPHSRAEHQAAYAPIDADACGDPDLERARRVWVLLTQGRGGTMLRTGWRFYRDPAGSTYSFPDYLAAYARRVPPAAQRIAGVTLECREGLEVADDYGRHDDVLLYVDPPYLLSTRNSRNYRHEFTTPEEHRELAEVLNRCRASVVLSGYDSPLYRDLYDGAGWRRVELNAWTGNGIRNGATKTDGDRTEVLWANRPIGEPTLFDGVGA